MFGRCPAQARPHLWQLPHGGRPGASHRHHHCAGRGVLLLRAGLDRLSPVPALPAAACCGPGHAAQLPQASFPANEHSGTTCIFACFAAYLVTSASTPCSRMPVQNWECRRSPMGKGATIAHTRLACLQEGQSTDLCAVCLSLVEGKPSCSQARFPFENALWQLLVCVCSLLWQPELVRIKLQ